MREYRSRADQPEPFVDREIVALVGEARGDFGDLVEILGEVGVEEDAGMLLQQPAGIGQLRVGGGEGETRRDRITKAPGAVPARDQGFGFGTAFGDAVG